MKIFFSLKKGSSNESLNRFSKNLTKNNPRKGVNDFDLNLHSKINTSGKNEKVKLTKQQPGLFGLIKKKKEKLNK